MATVLVTGANRGIGLQLCKQFAARGDDVVAVCRETTDELSALDVRVIDGIDVGSGTAVETLRQELDGLQIDILVNNAGILLRDTFGEIDFDAMAEQYRVNTLGPLRVSEALADNLHEGSKVAIVSSRVGSIEDNSSGGNYGYRASKSALNQFLRTLAIECRHRHPNATVLAIHPGTTDTGLSRPFQRNVPADKLYSPATSAQRILKVLHGAEPGMSGSFLNWDGREIPW